MGLSSSQARLLHLTARMHQIEYKAAKLEAQKLQMANKSRRVYQEYQEALEATKIQYKSLNEDASITFRDATADILQNACVPTYKGETSKKSYFLQDMDGKIMVTPTVADYYDLEEFDTNQTLNEYLDSILPAELKSTRMVPTGGYNEVLKEPLEIDTFNTIPNSIGSYPEDMNYTKKINEISNKVTDAVTMNCDGFVKKGNEMDIASGGTALSSLGDIANCTSLDSTIYSISTEAELRALRTLCQNVDTTGITFYLENDINLSGTEWYSINNFRGTFNGNGNVIRNLNQSGSLYKNAGLFGSIGSTAAVIKNVGIESSRITNTSAESGFILGYNVIGSTENPESDPNASGCKIENCYVKNSTINGAHHVGGICGTNFGTITDCNVSGINVGFNIGTTSNPQAICMGGISGHNSGAITNCHASGTVDGVWAGGIVGHCTGVNKTEITSCYSECIVNCTYNQTFEVNGKTYANTDGSGQIGEGHGSNHQLFIGSIVGYSETSKAIFSTEDNKKSYYYTEQDLKATGDKGDISGAFVQTNTVTVPSRDTFKCNVYAALVKANGNSSEGIDKNKINSYVNSIYGNSNSQNDLMRVANANYFITEYLKGSTLGAISAYISSLGTDTANGTISQSTKNLLDNNINPNYQYNTSSGTQNKTILVSNENCIWDPFGAKGEVTIPKSDTIAKELFYGFQKSGKITTEEWSASNSNYTVINSWVSSHSDSELADLNDAIKNGKWSEIYSSYDLGEKYKLNQTNYPSEKWNFHKNNNDTITVEYKKIKDPILEPEEYWDLSKPEVAQAAAMWALGQKGVIIIPEDQSSNYLYLKNILETGEAVLTTFDPSAAATAFENMTAQDILDMDETKYNEAMNIFNTNVAVETHLQEVADEKNLKKAEAKYEADMRRIDFKDRQYDRELAALEAERNATKNEMETLKTVAKDNVDRTFKLFS